MRRCYNDRTFKQIAPMKLFRTSIFTCAFTCTFTCALSLILALILPLPSHAADLWWSYYAAYNNKKSPGEIKINLALAKNAPFADYPLLVTTGTHYPTQLFGDGLPLETDVARLDAITAEVVATIAAKTESIYAGSFTSDGERRMYVYVKKPDGIEAALAAVYAKRACPKCKSSTYIRKDERWSAYTRFLYPNPQTREYYKKELIAMGIKVEQ